MPHENVPTIRRLLDEAPEKFNDKPFIRFIRDGLVREKTFSKVRADSLAFCRKIRDLCPDKAHIALVGKSSYEYITCLTGILVSGNVAVPVPPELSAEDAVKIFTDADVTAVLYEHAFAEKIAAILPRCPLIRHTFDLGDVSGFEKIYRDYGEDSVYAPLSEVAVDPQACALIIYTSGTTGERKGVMLSTYALVKNTMFKPYSAYCVNDDVLLSVLPMYHIFCFVSDYLAPLSRGNTLCLNGEMRDMFRNLALFRPGTIRLVPMIAQALLNYIKGFAAKHPELDPREAAARVTGGELRWLLSGGAYLDPVLCREFDRYGICLRQGYGMSEAGCKITVPDDRVSLESVGRVIDFCRARVRNGEIQVLTPCRMIGYYKRPEETAAAFTEDGWLRTGDAGVVTDYGELFITGRLKNLIILSNGENVSPEGIERRYKENLLVSEVQVYAERDRITAEIFPDPDYARRNGITDIPAALEAFTDELNRNALPSHTVAKVTARDTPFPKNLSGKMIRR
ncbi:MAG: AMP-binding protein [Clostridia bacterium]|nr:AMP-binding protein [Clostridia bacterium]